MPSSEAEDNEELQVGLAYWAVAYGDLANSRSSEVATVDWREALGVVGDAGRHVSAELPDSLIFRRMQIVAKDETFCAALDRVRIADLTSLARSALALLAATGDFTALHAVTATHAFRVLDLWMAEKGAALDAL